jgi:hypothetical protein
LLRVSPPPNDRGAGATKFVSVADSREHRWLVAAQPDTAAMQRTATTFGLRSELYGSHGSDAAIIVGPAPWESVKALVAALDSLNAAPLVARYESCTDSEVLQ